MCGVEESFCKLVPKFISLKQENFMLLLFYLTLVYAVQSH